MPCCAEEPRGFPLTLTKDIMVNGKVLHLESSPRARISGVGALAALTRAIALCLQFVLFVSFYRLVFWSDVTRSIKTLIRHLKHDAVKWLGYKTKMEFAGLTLCFNLNANV